MIYTDKCSEALQQAIAEELAEDIVLRMTDDDWNVNDAMTIITDPEIKLAVINRIDDISLMEVGLLHFMCKPILVTTKEVESYQAILRTVDYVDYQCDLTNPDSTFLTWFNSWRG